jgi:hypothetical protein
MTIPICRSRSGRAKARAARRERPRP